MGLRTDSNAGVVALPEPRPVSGEGAVRDSEGWTAPSPVPFTGGPLRVAAPAARLVREAANSGRFTVAFQPLVALPRQHVVGVEALARFGGPSVAAPDVWFARAEHAGVARGLEIAVVRRAFALWQSAPVGTGVSVNVSARTLADPDLLTALLAADLPYGAAVIELAAPGLGLDDVALAAVERLRAAGARLALTGVGREGQGDGQVGSLLRRLRPEVVKLHRDVVTRLRRSGQRDAVRPVQLHARQHGAVVIAEGVETADDLQAALAGGADLAQGFYFGHPSTQPAVWRAWARAALTA